MQEVINSMYYIATFYSHFAAIRFKRELKEIISEPKMMPVPRTLSSSCGTCVRFKAADKFEYIPDESEEIEQIVRETGDGYIMVYIAQGN